MTSDSKIYATVVDVITQMRDKKYQMISTYALRQEDIKGYSLGPNEFLSFRVEMTESFQGFREIRDIARATELEFEGHPVYCSDNHGVHLLVDRAFHVMIEEARKNLDMKGMN